MFFVLFMIGVAALIPTNPLYSCGSVDVCDAILDNLFLNVTNSVNNLIDLIFSTQNDQFSCPNSGM